MPVYKYTAQVSLPDSQDIIVNTMSWMWSVEPKSNSHRQLSLKYILTTLISQRCHKSILWTEVACNTMEDVWTEVG